MVSTPLNTSHRVVFGVWCWVRPGWQELEKEREREGVHTFFGRTPTHRATLQKGRLPTVPSCQGEGP